MTNIVLSSVLEPHYLTHDYKNHLLSIYKNKYESTGNDIGYIVNILAIKDIISTNLNNDSQIIVESLCNCNIFKPDIGMKVDCVIDMIHINGIFVSKYTIKILIPSSNNNYEYCNNSFKMGGKEFKVGDTIQIEIVNIRYDKYIYSCIGKLILKD
jgi:DNA-directed RNA polymerase subunit E'/Rpb7